MARKFSGITIHSGWFPQLLKGSPSKKFSHSKSNKGISVKGYNRKFVEQVQRLKEEKANEINSFGLSGLSGLLNTPLLTSYGALQSTAQGGMSLISALQVMGQETRSRAWRDVVSAKEYEDRSKAMSIRGNHIWYLLGKSGPKEMAQALLDRPNFSFEAAENWYHSNVPKGTGQAKWAQKVLGLDNANIDKTISVADVLKKGDVAEELIFKEGKGPDDGEIGKSVPPKTGTRAQSRDMVTKKFGEIESTEVLSSEAHHGYPANAIKTATGKGKLTVAKWTKFMKGTVIKSWNDYSMSVLSSVKKETKAKNVTKAVKTKAVAAITGTKAAKMSVHTATGAGTKFLQKMRHEFSIANIKDNSKEFGTKWKDGIPITDRDSTGNRTYASSDIELNKNLLFKLNKVQFVSGLNHVAALLAADKGTVVTDSVAYYVSQQNHLAHSRMNNTTTAETVNGITSSGIGELGSVPSKVNVSFSIKQGEAWLAEVTKQIGNDIGKKAGARTKEIQGELSSKAKAMGSYGDIFWALPYISIEEGLYKG